MIARLAEQTFVSLEFGVESIHDDTLRRVNRGHDYAAFLRAMDLVRGRPIHVGAHVVLGFPWETRSQWLAMADEMSRVGVDALKIHHLHVVRGTALAAEYSRRPFRVLEYQEYLDLLCEFVQRLDPGIVIERMFGEAPFGLLVAPNWRRNKNELVLDIKRVFEERNVVQGSKRIGQVAPPAP
jgi:radical SAM protein (TIGR01212 family)